MVTKVSLLKLVGGLAQRTPITQVLLSASVSAGWLHHAVSIRVVEVKVEALPVRTDRESVGFTVAVFVPSESPSSIQSFDGEVPELDTGTNDFDKSPRLILCHPAHAPAQLSARPVPLPKRCSRNRPKTQHRSAYPPLAKPSMPRLRASPAQRRPALVRSSGLLCGIGRCVQPQSRIEPC